MDLAGHQRRRANGGPRVLAGAVPDGEFWASNVDPAGDIWQGSQKGKIFRWRFGGLDKGGTPIYSPENVEIDQIPPPMNHLLRTEYLPETDTMYLSGYTADRPMTGDEWGIVGSEILRFDHWSKGNRVPPGESSCPTTPNAQPPSSSPSARLGNLPLLWRAARR